MPPKQEIEYANYKYNVGETMNAEPTVVQEPAQPIAKSEEQIVEVKKLGPTTAPSTYQKLAAVRRTMNEYSKYWGARRICRPPLFAWAKEQRQFKCA